LRVKLSAEPKEETRGEGGERGEEEEERRSARSSPSTCNQIPF
jgi:hypothetical protein